MMICIHILFLSLSMLLQQQEAPSLDSVLKKMDAAAANFHAVQADFVWDQYQRVVDEHDLQKGTVYYRRTGKDIEMMAEITEPDRKFLLYKDGKVQIYQPKIDQVLQYSTGGNRNEIESYLVLGFGGSGQELTKSYDVSFQGEETIDHIANGEVAADSEERESAQQLFLAGIAVDRSEPRHLRATTVLRNTRRLSPSQVFFGADEGEDRRRSVSVENHEEDAVCLASRVSD